MKIKSSDNSTLFLEADPPKLIKKMQNIRVRSGKNRCIYSCSFFFDLRASISRGSYGDLYWMARKHVRTDTRELTNLELLCRSGEIPA